MRVYKSVEVPAITREILDFVQCDLCGCNIKEESLYQTYQTDEVEVRHRTGVEYPEGGHGVETRVDLCGACFDDKLIPWLESQGVKPNNTEWEW